MTLLEFGPPVVFMKTPASPPNIKSEIKPKKAYVFDAKTFLDSGNWARKIVEFNAKETIFCQGNACSSVMFIQKSAVTKSSDTLNRIHSQHEIIRLTIAAWQRLTRSSLCANAGQVPIRGQARPDQKNVLV